VAVATQRLASHSGHPPPAGVVAAWIVADVVHGCHRRLASLGICSADWCGRWPGPGARPSCRAEGLGRSGRLRPSKAATSPRLHRVSGALIPYRAIRQYKAVVVCRVSVDA
jgi:hypothetical protein